MSSVERELWDVFTTYTLFGNALDPFHISYNTLSKLCKDCGLFELDAFPGYLTEADLYVLFIRESRALKRGNRRSQTSAGSGQPPPVPYGVFLTLLLKISERLFTPASMLQEPDAEEPLEPVLLPFTPQQCLQKLLMEHIFVETQKDEQRKIRRNLKVDELLEDEKVKALFRFYKPSLKQLFNFFSQMSADTHNKHINVLRRGVTLRLFDQRHRNSIVEQGKPTAADKTLGYDQYIQLARELGCGSLIKISVVDLGDAYLTTILPRTTAGMLDVKRMTFPQFWECLVRWAVLSQVDRDGDSASIDEKLKGMFLEMWYHLQDSIPNMMGTLYVANPSVGESSKAEFLRGCQALNERFVKMWANDNYRIYLAPQEPPKRNAAEILDLAIKEMRALADVRHVTISQYLNTNLAAARDDVILEVSGDGAEAVGDSRITVSMLNKLLQNRPECSKYLFAQLKSYQAST